jgi:exodeoxyribonuclease-3
LKIATWNVNGIRARQADVLAWMAEARPDILCLQELKAAPDQVPSALLELEGYTSYWHGLKAYSGVALLIRKETFPEPPRFAHPAFDMESRIVTATLGGLEVASIYVPNGGKDFDAKMRFLRAMKELAAEAQKAGRQVVLCGDLNVARADRDVHPKERKAVIGQLPEERALFEEILGCGLVDVGRALDPDNENLFTWFAPWRNMKQRNIGWRLDYLLVSEPLAKRATECSVLRLTGTSDHAPVVAVFGD